MFCSSSTSMWGSRRGLQRTLNQCWKCRLTVQVEAFQRLTENFKKKSRSSRLQQYMSGLKITPPFTFIFSLISLLTGGHLNLCKFLFNPPRWQFQCLFWSQSSWQATSGPVSLSLSFLSRVENNLPLGVMIQTPSLHGVGLIGFHSLRVPRETNCHIFFQAKKLTAGG